MEFTLDSVSKAQGFKEPGPEEVNLDPVEPLPELSQEEKEKQETEKMFLFSECVAAEAEASKPVIKEEKKETPLHFKYYKNEGDDELSLTENIADDILGRASN